MRKLKNSLALGLIVACAAVATLPLFLIFFYVFVNGYEGVTWGFFTESSAPPGTEGGGMANALVGSFYVISVATFLGVPIGILLGVYLAEFQNSPLLNVLRTVMDLLTSVPSIVIGIFAYTLLVMPMGHYSAVAGGFALFVIMLPQIVRATEEVLKLVPNSVREAGIALGLPRWKVIIFIVLRAARPAIATGVILSIARVSGESAPLLFTAFGNQFWSTSLTEPIATIPVQIYYYAISPYAEWHKLAWSGALVLLLIVLVLNVLTRKLTKNPGS